MYDRAMSEIAKERAWRQSDLKWKEVKHDIVMSIVKASPYFLVYTSAALVTTLAIYRDLFIVPLISLFLLLGITEVCFMLAKHQSKKIVIMKDILSRIELEIQERTSNGIREFRRVSSRINVGHPTFKEVNMGNPRLSGPTSTLVSYSGMRLAEDMRFIDESVAISLDLSFCLIQEYYNRLDDFYNACLPTMVDLEGKSHVYYSALKDPIMEYGLSNKQELVILFRAYVGQDLLENGEPITQDLTDFNKSQMAFFGLLIDPEALGNILPRMMKMRDFHKIAVEANNLRMTYAKLRESLSDEISFKFGKMMIEMSE